MCGQAGEIITGLQSVPVYKLPLMLSAPRKFSWENAFIDLSMADNDTQAAAAAEAKEAAMAAAAAEAADAAAVGTPGNIYTCLHAACWPTVIHVTHACVRSATITSLW